MADSRVKITIVAKDTASRAIGKISKSFRSLGNTLRGPKGLLGTVTKFFGLFAGISFVKGSVRAFGEQEDAIESLRASLIATGKDGSNALRTLADEASRLQSITKFGDEAILSATEALNTLSGSLTGPELKEAQTALVGLAAGFFKGDIQSAAAILGKTLGSSLNALSRYGIEIDGTLSASEKLAQLLASPKMKAAFEVAKAQAKTLTGQIVQAKNAFGDFREAIGRVVVEAAGFGEQAGSLRERFEGWTAALNENREVIVAWIKAVLVSFKFVGTGFRDLVLAAFHFGEIIGNFFRTFVAGLGRAGVEIANIAVDAINVVIGLALKATKYIGGQYEQVLRDMAEAANALLPKKFEIDVESINVAAADVDVEWRINGLDADKAAARFTTEQNRLTASIAATGGALGSLIEGWKGVAEATGLAYYAEGRASSPLRDLVGSTGAGLGAADAGIGATGGAGDGLLKPPEVVAENVGVASIIPPPVFPELPDEIELPPYAEAPDAPVYPGPELPTLPGEIALPPFAETPDAPTYPGPVLPILEDEIDLPEFAPVPGAPEYPEPVLPILPAEIVLPPYGETPQAPTYPSPILPDLEEEIVLPAYGETPPSPEYPEPIVPALPKFLPLPGFGPLPSAPVYPMPVFPDLPEEIPLPPYEEPPEPPPPRAAPEVPYVPVDPFVEAGRGLDYMSGPLDDVALGFETGIDAVQRFGFALREMTGSADVMSKVYADIIFQLASELPGAFETATKAALSGEKSVGAAFASAWLNAIASVARAQAQLYAAKAIGALGEGLISKDPSAFAAAAKFAAASAAFGVLAGALSYASAGGGGGGGGGGTFSASQSDAIGAATKPEATLIIEGGDLLDLSDPKTEDQLRRALEDIGDRRVTIVRR